MFAKLLLAFAVASTVYAVEFQIVNNSPDTPVFVQLLGTQYPDPFTLNGGEQVCWEYLHLEIESFFFSRKL